MAIAVKTVISLLEKCSPDALVYICVPGSTVGHGDELEFIESCPIDKTVHFHCEKPNFADTDYLPFVKIHSISVVVEESHFAETEYRTNSTRN